jgi:hypothetical protein
VFLELAVRVQPQNEPSFDAKMKVGILNMHLPKQGINVQVKYDARKPASVEYDDNPQAILDRNPQLMQSPSQ